MAEAQPGRRTLPPIDERGSGTALMAALLVVVLIVVGAVLVVSGYLLASHRARVLADLGALSGAADVARGQDPCRSVRAVVEQRGAQVTRCSWVGDQTDYVVTVQVTVSVSTHIPGSPQSVVAAGNAGPVQLAVEPQRLPNTTGERQTSAQTG